MSMPVALVLAAMVIVGLFAVAAVVAPQLAPAFAPGGPNALGSGSPSPTTASAGPSVSATASAGVSASPSKKPSPKPTSTGSDKITTYEDQVLRLVNAERGKAGCGAVHADSHLHKAARDFSALMAAKNFFDHTSPDGSTFVDR